jgi:AmiR/NasT family two-component response regulator
MPTRILLADDETIQRMDLKEMLICSRTRCKNSKVLC